MQKGGLLFSIWGFWKIDKGTWADWRGFLELQELYYLPDSFGAISGFPESARCRAGAGERAIWYG